MLTLSDQAVNHLRQLLAAKAEDATQGLRLTVEKGGCAGMQYAMKIDAAAEGDEIVEKDGVRLFVDPSSLEFLDGSVVDYVDDLNDAGFKVSNPRAARSCGCGTSFEPENLPGNT